MARMGEKRNVYRGVLLKFRKIPLEDLGEDRIILNVSFIPVAADRNR